MQIPIEHSLNNSELNKRRANMHEHHPTQPSTMLKITRSARGTHHQYKQAVVEHYNHGSNEGYYYIYWGLFIRLENARHVSQHFSPHPSLIT